MENTKPSIWAYFVDVMRAFRAEESDKQREEKLSDIPESYCKENNVTKEQMEVLKASDAKLSGKKPEKSEKNKEEKRNNFVQKNYNSGSAGGSKGKTVANSKEVEIVGKPDNELVK